MTPSLQDLYVFILTGGLLLVGIWHIIAGASTEAIFREPRNVRLLGFAILILAVPCFIWRGHYFLAIGILMFAHGSLRAFAPHLNVRLQKSAYPRWVHGWIISGSAVLAFAAYELNWLSH